MSNCPNCGRHLRITDWRPNCPQCGVNLMFYGFEDRFYEDAKRSELSLASTRVSVKQKKAAMKGNAAAKTRLFCCILPLVSLFIPWGALCANLPFVEKQWSAGIMTLINLVMGMMGGGTEDIGYLRGMLHSAQAPLFKAGVFMLLALVLAFVLSLAAFVASMLSFIELRRGSLAAAIICVLGALDCVGGGIAVIMLRQSSAALNSPVFSGKIGLGAPAALAMFVFIGVLNFILYKKGVPVEYAEGDLERHEIYMKVKRGEVQLADLPFPVVVTESAQAGTDSEKEGAAT